MPDMKSLRLKGAAGNNGRLTPGRWHPVREINRLRVAGTGTLSIDAKDTAGAISTAVFLQSYVSSPGAVEYVYPGDAGVEIRATFPSTLTVEVI